MYLRIIESQRNELNNKEPNNNQHNMNRKLSTFTTNKPVNIK